MNFCLSKETSKHYSIQVLLWSFLTAFCQVYIGEEQKVGENAHSGKKKCALVYMVAVEKLVL